MLLKKHYIQSIHPFVKKKGGKGKVGFCNQHTHCMYPFQLLNKLNDFKTLGTTIMQLRTPHCS